MNIFTHFSQTERGFTLLYASLMGSLLLAIGAAILNITLKELILSSAGRESQFAFFAADSGAECALYWDLKYDSFATSSASSITCAGETIPNMGGGGNANPTSVFNLTFAPENYCAEVSVTKEGLSTILESRGYNTCDTANSRRVERAIRVRY